MSYVQRKNGAIVGAYGLPQPGFAEELLADDNAELVVFLNPPRDPRLITDDAERSAAKQDAAILALINSTPSQCVTFARNNFPSLTLAEQNRIGMLINILAVAVRPAVR